MTSSIEALNQTLFLLLNAAAGTPAYWLSLGAFLANDLILLLPLLLIMLWARGERQTKDTALLAVFVALTGLLISYVIGQLWYYPRPFVAGIGHTWIPHAPNYSFPSDHFTLIACVAVTLLLRGLKVIGVLTLAGGLCVAWARIYMGVHYPLDMLGAALNALFSYALCSQLWRSIGAPITSVFEAIHQKLFAGFIRRGIMR